ncbi:MAG: diguanylate cyclase [Acidobacteriota bacterium]
MSGARLLVIDDSDVTRALLARTLTRAGFAVLQARDGLEGAVLALSERPQVVITDLEMPGMDGYQLLRFMKSDPASADIPVLILTSHSEAPSRYWGMQVGADAYIVKDTDSSELIATVNRLVAAAPHPAKIASLPPQSSIEVFGRVTRQLDAALLRATLESRLLERGMAGGDTRETNLTALGTVADVVDAHALAVAVAEPDTVALHALLTDELSHDVVQRLASAILAGLAVTPGANVEVVVHGDQGGGAPLGLDNLLLLPLPLRGASGLLAILPRDAGQFETASRHLVEAIIKPLALVLDNARLAQRLRELSMVDGLTRMLNHRAIHERLGEELERAQRYGHPLAIVIADLDHFKRVNDTHGHLAGDAVLRAAAQAMRRALRTADSLGRYGGEEFLAVLPESDLDAGRLAAERLRLAVGDHPISLPSGNAITLTASFGVAARAELPAPASADGLVLLADTRLYEAKSAGRNRVRP